MYTHLMICLAVMLAVVGIVASRDLLRMRRAQLQPVSLRVRRDGELPSRSHDLR